MPYDPYDAAMNPPERPQTSRWFGQMFVDVWPCVLTKGVGKEPYDDAVHDADKRLTAIQLELVPLSDYSVSFTMTRDLIAEFGAWPKVTLPSIKAIGADLRSLNKAWAAIEFAPTGRKYTNSQDEAKEETTFVFVAVFDSEAACREAYEVFNAVEADASEPAEPTNGNGKERAAAAMFLNPLWVQSGKDVVKFSELLGKTNVVKDHFTLESPEVQEVIAS